MNKPVLLEIKKPWRSIMDSIDNLRTCSYYLIANPDVIKSAQIPFCQKISKVKDIPVGLVCEDAYSNCAGFLLSQSKNLALPEALREEAENAFTTLNNQRLNCSNIPHA